MFGKKTDRMVGTCGTYQKYKLHVIRTQEGLARENKTDKFFKEIMVKNSPNVCKTFYTNKRLSKSQVRIIEIKLNLSTES